MKKYWIILILFFVYSQSFSQKIKIIDDSNNPIPFVSIFDNLKKKGIITDKNGEANLEIFNGNEIIVIQHPSYEKTNLKLKEIIENNYIIKLNEKIFKIDEIVISANKWEQSKSDISSQILDLSENEIKYLNPGTSAELLEKTGQIFVQKSQLGGGSPMIRGFSANRILIVLDGIRLNNAIYRSGNLHNIISIDPNVLEGAEVLFGPASVIYGSDAIGGVMDFHTKNIKFSTEKNLIFNGNSLIKYYSASNSKHFNLNLTFANKNFCSFSSISLKNFDDLKTGNKRTKEYPDYGKRLEFVEVGNSDLIVTNKNYNIQKYSGYSQINLIQKFKFKLLKNHLISYNIYYSNSSNIPRYDRLIQYSDFFSPRYSEWYYGPQKRFFISPQFKFFLGKEWMKKGTMTFAYQKVEESRVNRKFSEIIRSNKLESVDVFSLNADFYGHSKGGHSYSYGLEWAQNKINSRAYAFDLELDFESITGFINQRPIPSRYPDNGSSATSFAIYLNWIFELNKRLNLNAGLRLTSSNLNGNWNKIASVDKLLSSIKLDSEALTYTLAITYRPNEKLKINGLLSSGFRNPNIDDIGKIRENNGILLVPNSFLKPEYAYTFESGIKIRSNNQKSYFDLRGFSTLVSRHIVRSNFIVFSDTSTEDQNTIIYNGDEVLTQANKNLGNRFIYGLCFEGKLSLGSLMKLYGGVNFTSSDKNPDYGPMPSIAPFFGTFTFSRQYRKWSHFLIWKFSASKKPRDFSWGGEDGLNETPIIDPNASLEKDRFYGMPSWNSFSLLAQYFFNENIKLTLGLNNIFDIHYRTFASGISSEGRSFQLGVKVKF